jgi:hypothetical protein
MTSKLKTDILETVSGSGTIALTNQLTGMTTASLPALGSAQMPTGSLLKTTNYNYPSNTTTSSSSFVNAGGTAPVYTVVNAGCDLLVTHSFDMARHANTNYWVYAQLLINGSLLAPSLHVGTHGQSNDYERINFDAYITGQSFTAGQTLTFQMQIKSSAGQNAALDDAGGGPQSLTIQEIKG